MRSLIVLTLIGILTACGAKTDSDSSNQVSSDASSNSLSTPAKKESAYCTFYVQDANYVAEDNSTWKWVAKIQSKAATSTASFRIGDFEETLNIGEITEYDQGETRIYMGNDGSAVQLTMKPAGNTADKRSYTGEVRKVAPDVSAPIPVTGNCG